MTQVTHRTALVVIPPIQTIRAEHDLKVGRWMPHITLVYPFLHAGEFAVRGPGRYWRLRRGGHNHIFPDGTNEWRAAPDRANHVLLEWVPRGDRRADGPPARAGPLTQGGSFRSLVRRTPASLRPRPR